MAILDIKAVDEKSVLYDIEMQITEQGFYDKRALEEKNTKVNF